LMEGVEKEYQIKLKFLKMAFVSLLLSAGG
jgi:hypothetical protein